MKDPMHTTVCDRCYRGTWYETEQPCHMENRRPTTCQCCGHREVEPGPCGGTLRIINRAELASQFQRYYETGERIKVLSVYGEVRTGTVGKTGGWVPSYLLMPRSDSTGSSDLLRDSDMVVAVKRGSKYVPTA